MTSSSGNTKSAESSHSARVASRESVNEAERQQIGLFHRFVAWSMDHVLRILCASWRKDIEGLDVLDSLVASGRPHVAAFWHRKYIALFALLKGRHACVVTSNSASWTCDSDNLPPIWVYDGSAAGL